MAQRYLVTMTHAFPEENGKWVRAEDHAELEAAAKALLDWDKKYPKGTIYNGTGFRACEAELTECVERFRALLPPN